MLKKRLLCCLLAILLVFGTISPVFAYSTSFHQSGDSYTIDCNNHTVSVTAGKAYQSGYLLVRLMNTSGNTVKQSSASAKSVIQLSVADLSDGVYYVELFTGTAASGSFLSYASGYHTIPIQVTSGMATLTVSDNWVYNLGIFLQNRSDSFALSYYRKAEENPVLETMAKQLSQGCSTDYQKIKAVHDWVASTIAYDYDHADSDIPTDAAAVYSLGYTNAKGYTNLTAALLRHCGIAAKVVKGYVQTVDLPLNPEHKYADAHHWNEAYDSQNQRWVILDSCWNSANVYENGRLSLAKGYDRYFDPTLEAFSTDHLLEQNEDTAGLKAAFDAEAEKIKVTFARTKLYTEEIYNSAKISVEIPDSLKEHVKVSYSTGNKKKVAVSKKGNIFGTGYGKTHITVKISDGTNSYSVKQLIRCYNPYLQFKKSVSSLKKGKTYTFTVGKYGLTGNVKWKVSDKSIATISSSGKLTGKKAGTVTVTAYIGDVKVTKKVKITK